MRSNFPIVSLGKYVRQVSQRNKVESGTEVFSVTNSEGFTRSTEYFSKEVFSKDISNYKVVLNGQFAYNPSRINVGSIDYLRTEDKVLVSPLYVVFQVAPELDADYLLHYLKSDWGNAQIRANTEGAVRDSLKYKGPENIQIPLPQFGDQKRIAHLLGNVEKLISRRKNQLQRLDDLLKSVFLKMFGDPVQNEKGWKNCTLKNGCDEIYRYPTFYGFEYSSEGIPVVRIGNILPDGNIDPDLKNYVFVPKEISDRYPRTILKANDIVMAVRGDGSTGKRIGIINSANLVGANMSPNLLRMSCNQNIFNPVYFFHFLTSERGQVFISRNISRTAKKTITAENLKTISIPRPPINLQDQFSEIVKRIEIIKSRYHKNLTDLEDLCDSLSQRAFKGELDLSRVLLPAVGPEIAEVGKLDTEGKHSMEQSFELPAPANLDLLHSPDGRKSLIGHWLAVWLDQLGDAPFIAQPFMEAARQRIRDLAEDEAPDWGVAEYDELKSRVFEALEQNQLIQSYDGANHRVQVTAAKG